MFLVVVGAGGRRTGGGEIRNSKFAPQLRDPACAGDFGLGGREERE